LPTCNRVYAIYLLVPCQPVDFVKGAQVVTQESAMNQQAVALHSRLMRLNDDCVSIKFLGIILCALTGFVYKRILGDFLDLF